MSDFKIKHPIELRFSDTNQIFCGIYKITSIAGKIYIGQSINIYKRWCNNYKYLKCKGQPKLYNSFKKYGLESHKFEIIHTCECDAETLEYWEDYYINMFNSTDRELGLNLRGGGKHGKITEESREKNRLSHLGKVTIVSKEAIERREAKKLATKLRKEEERRIRRELLAIEKLTRPKKKKSEEHKMKISKTLKGRKLPQSQIDKTKQTLEIKRQNHGGKIIFSQDHRNKLSKAGEKRPVSEKTMQVLRKNWERGRTTIVKGRKMDDKYRESVKNGWIKRRNDMRKETDAFMHLSKEEQSAVICVLVIARMFNKKSKYPKNFMQIRYGITKYRKMISNN